MIHFMGNIDEKHFIFPKIPVYLYQAEVSYHTFRGNPKKKTMLFLSGNEQDLEYFDLMVQNDFFPGKCQNPYIIELTFAGVLYPAYRDGKIVFEGDETAVHLLDNTHPKNRMEDQNLIRYLQIRKLLYSYETVRGNKRENYKYVFSGSDQPFYQWVDSFNEKNP